MNIPQSTIEPFGVIGIPPFAVIYSTVDIIIDAMHDMTNDPRMIHLSPAMMGILIKRTASKNDAHNITRDAMLMDDGSIIYKVSFKIEHDSARYLAFPCYSPTPRRKR